MTSPAILLIDVCQRAIELHRRGQLVPALQLCEEVLRVEPDYPVALHLSGLIALQTGNPREAIDLMSRAIAISPGVASAHCNLAIAHKQLLHPEAALENLTKAILLEPGLAVAHLNRAALFAELDQPQAALQDYDRSIELAESSGSCPATLHVDRGAVLANLKNFEAALADFDRAIVIDGACATAHYNRGVVLARLGKRDAALENYSQAISINPAFAQAHLNRGVTLAEVARPAEALESFEQAIHSSPDFAEAHFGKALVLLLLGDYRNGWQEYEWRWKNKSGSTFSDKRDFPQPLWLGDAPISGKTILLHAEQGFGDTVQFCRYAPFVAELGASVVLEVPANLVTLLQSLRGPSYVVARGDALPEFDVHCPLMSLPLAFRTTLDTIPAKVPYLGVDAAKIRDWDRALGTRNKYRVGLVWSGRAPSTKVHASTSFNSRRDLPIAALGVLGFADVQFYSLQTGPAAGAQIAQLVAQCDDLAIVDCGKDLADFADTAALIHHLDLVITVDTAIAHLAGALGKQVWILNRLDTCWRWLLDRADSPWYPTARIYRQTRLGSWDDVLLKVCMDLKATIG